MAEEPEVIEKQPDTPPIEPTPEPETPPAESEPAGEPEKEPGGADGEAVYGRRLFRENKNLKAENQREREARLQLEARLKTLEEERGRPKEEKVFSPEEVEAAVEAGTITRAQAASYYIKLGGVEARRVIETERQKEESRRPIARAIEEINHYRELIPQLEDRGSEHFTRAAGEYRRLLDRGFPDNEVTQLQAVENAFGRLDKLKKTRDVNAATRDSVRFSSDTPAGGGNGPRPNSWQKASFDQKALWDKLGTTDKERAKEWDYIQQRDQRRGTK